MVFNKSLAKKRKEKNVFVFFSLKLNFFINLKFQFNQSQFSNTYLLITPQRIVFTQKIRKHSSVSLKVQEEEACCLLPGLAGKTRAPDWLAQPTHSKQCSYWLTQLSLFRLTAAPTNHTHCYLYNTPEMPVQLFIGFITTLNH